MKRPRSKAGPMMVLVAPGWAFRLQLPEVGIGEDRY